MSAAPCPVPSSSWQQASVLLHKGPHTKLSIHTCLHEAQDIMWIWFEIPIMDKINLTFHKDNRVKHSLLCMHRFP